MTVSEEMLRELIMTLVGAARAEANTQPHIDSDTCTKLCDAIDYLHSKLKEMEAWNEPV